MIDCWQAVSEVGPERGQKIENQSKQHKNGLNVEITSKCDVITCYECFFVEFSRYGVTFRRISTLSDDRLDGFNRFGCHVPGPGIGVGWGNSLSVGTNVES